MPGLDETDVFVALVTRMSAEEAVRWLLSPHPLLDDRAPDALIAEGRTAEVRALINNGNAGTR
jgi:uncharacterized protein (DUF2384 family)